jgi:hypothetical protein
VRGHVVGRDIDLGHTGFIGYLAGKKDQGEIETP